MKRHVTLALVACSGTLASAQNVVNVSMTWSEMVAGTNTPVLNPNGFVEPGEAALIQFGMYATRNGTNAVGQVMTAGTFPVWTGPVLGFGSFVYDLIGDIPGASGAWHVRQVSTVFIFGVHPGYISEDGAVITAMGGAQNMAPGSSVDPANPITPTWRGVWTPHDYTTRTTHFAVRASVAVPANQQNSMVMEIGPDPSSGLPMRYPCYFQSNFGPGIDIPIDSGDFGEPALCYPNCDGSTKSPLLNVNDFVCYLNLFSSGDTRANCDGSLRQPLLTANDFLCYLNKFASGCN